MENYEGIPIFLVIGETGEYDDYQNWIVSAYRDHDSALNHAKKAIEEAKIVFDGRDKSPLKSLHKGIYDENMSIDYTGTNYYVEETFLHAAFRL